MQKHALSRTDIVMGAKAMAMAVLTGMSAGFVAGFTVAENLYADEREIEHMRKRAKIMAAVTVGLIAFSTISMKVATN